MPVANIKKLLKSVAPPPPDIWRSLLNNNVWSRLALVEEVQGMCCPEYHDSCEFGVLRHSIDK